MSRLYWSNLPEAKRPRGGTSTLCSSLTTDDLPMPEYPETSTSSGFPLVTIRLKAASRRRHTSELQSQSNLVCRLLLEKKKTNTVPLSTEQTTAPRCTSSKT